MSTSSKNSSINLRKSGYKVRRNEKGETELHRACISGEYKNVERLLLKGHPVNEKDNGGWTCLHEACNWGHVAIVRLLIEHGANIEAKGMGDVTPLLDAAANGQFDITNLLLDAGAKISALDRDGNTVLDLLKTYKDNSDSLTEYEEAEYQKLATGLEERMRKDGIPLHRVSRTQNSSTGLASSRRLNNRNATSRTGADVYKTVISSVGRSAARKQSAIFNYESFNANRRSRRDDSSTSKSGLVSEKEYEVSDDWMIDDLNGHYIRMDAGGDSKKRSLVRGSRDSSPSDETEHSVENQDSATPTNADDCFDSEEIVGTVEDRPATNRDFDDDLLLVEERPAIRRSPKRRRLRQLRLTVTTPTPRPEIFNDDVVFTGQDDTIVEVVQPRRNASTVPIQPAESANRRVSDIVRVNVVVDGRKFAVIIDNRLHTIEWLADKVSANYESATGKRPVIRLYTSDDAALSASDTVEFLFHGNEELIGKVERIDVLPMEDNYRQVCQRLKQESCNDICGLLRNAGQSTVLDLRSTCLRAVGGSSTVLKALQSEYSLTSLNLRGQKMTTADATELGRTLISLQYLSNLVVSCTGMHCEQVLALATEMCREREKRYVLEKLDISFNVIGDSSASHLSRILLRCPRLTFLNLQCISATSRFVHDYKTSLREAFSGVPLTYLDLSKNRLGDVAAADLRSILDSSERYVELKLY